VFQHGLTVGWILNAPWNKPLVRAWTAYADPQTSKAGDQDVANANRIGSGLSVVVTLPWGNNLSC
jgi:hypothetical protein